VSAKATGSDKNADPLIVIASNRGPYSFKKREDGKFDMNRGEGGLVTALAGIADRYDVLWIAAALSDDDREWAQAHADEPTDVGDMRIQMLIPDSDAYYKYYNVISNPLLWFTQHELWDIPRNPVITEETWDAWHEGYVAVNRQFAETISASIPKTKQPVLIFPQDYQLYMVPHFLREKLGDRAQIQPFCHIPWPGPDAWRSLPPKIRNPLFSSLLQSDRVGFQTETDAFNFIQTCRFHLPDAHARGRRDYIEYAGRKTTAKAYPISIDVEKVQELAQDPLTTMYKQQVINEIGASRQFSLILRTDRIEPSKNILRGLLAYRTLLEKYPEHRGKVKMLQLLVPSRMEVDEYQTYLQEVMGTTASIEADFSDAYWEPVRTIIGNNYPRALAAMQVYDVLLVNPVNDGMNLVAKEGALLNENDGVLVLSEHAGAFYELGEHALTISPFDVYGMAEAMHEALTMSAEDRERRAKALKQQVIDNPVTQWFYLQVADALAALKSQSKKASTSSTPSASKSAASKTAAGVSPETTPNASE
jgi:trehalose 6-phosphate synthase